MMTEPREGGTGQDSVAAAMMCTDPWTRLRSQLQFLEPDQHVEHQVGRLAPIDRSKLEIIITECLTENACIQPQHIPWPRYFEKQMGNLHRVVYIAATW